MRQIQQWLKEDAFASGYADKECDALLKVGFQHCRVSCYLLFTYEYEFFRISIGPE